MMVEQLNQMAAGWWGWMGPMFWQVGVLVAIVAALDLGVRRWAWPQVRYALWLLVVVKLLVPPGWTLPTSVMSEFGGWVDDYSTVFFTAENAEKLDSSNHEGTKTQRQKEGTELQRFKGTKGLKRADDYLVFDRVKTGVGREDEVAVEPGGVEAGGERLAEAEQQKVGLNWQVWAMGGWFVGVWVLGGWLMIRLSTLRAIYARQKGDMEVPLWLTEELAATAQRVGLKRAVRLVLSERVNCPAVFGCVRPVLLLPAEQVKGLTRREAEHILLHELSHIKRGDLWVHGLWMVLQVLYWFHPLLWWVGRQMRHVRELCCDATVAKVLREKTGDYRETLLETARQLLDRPVEPGLGLLGLFEDSNRLLARLHWLEKKTWRYRPLRIATVLIVIGLMVGCVLPMAQGEKEITAEEIIEAAREKENWIHDINSISIKIDSQFTNSPQKIAKEKARWKKMYPDMEIGEDTFADLRPVTYDQVEIMMDGQRLRNLYATESNYQLRVWDGRMAIVHEKDSNNDQELYAIDDKPDRLVGQRFWGLINWLRAGPHAFWYDSTPREQMEGLYGRAEEYELLGREDFRGKDCYVLSYNSGFRQMLIGVEDHFLHGIRKRAFKQHSEERQAEMVKIAEEFGGDLHSYPNWHSWAQTLDPATHAEVMKVYYLRLAKYSQLSAELWLGDYREVAPGCFFPMMQGYVHFDDDDDSIAAQRDMKCVAIEVNKPVADDLFTIELQEGIKVYDRRVEPAMEYNSYTEIEDFDTQNTLQEPHGPQAHPTDVAEETYKSYFPDDGEGGRRLDALWESEGKDSFDDVYILQTVRKGLRRTKHHKTLILRWIGNRYIWNKQPSYAVKLLNGVTVELVGVRERNGKDNQWWRPDGSSLAPVAYWAVKGETGFVGAYDILLRVEGDLGAALSKSDLKIEVTSGGVNEPDQPHVYHGEVLEGYFGWWVAAVKGEQMEVIVGVPCGVWERQGQEISRETLLESLEIPDSPGLVFHVIDYGTEDMVELYKTVEKKGRTYIPAYMQDNKSIRMIVTDLEGKRHVGRNMMDRYIQEFSRAGGKRIMFRFSLSPEEMAGMVIERRPNTVVMFQNVSLRPDHKTDVVVKVKESPEDGAGQSGSREPQGQDATEKLPDETYIEKMYNMRQVVSGCQLYAADHDDQLPENIYEIQPYVENLVLHKKITYLGQGHFTTESGDKTILAYDTSFAEEKGFMVAAFLDGHVDKMTLSELEAVLSLSREERVRQKSEKMPFYIVTITADEGGVIYGKEILDFETLWAKLTTLKNRNRTALEVAFVPGVLPVFENGEQRRKWLDGEGEKVWLTAGRLVKELGFTSISFVEMDEANTKPGSLSIRAKAPIEIDKKVEFDLSSFDNVLLLKIKSAAFAKDGNRLGARLKLAVTSYPKKRWEIGVWLLDELGHQVDSVVRMFENSGIIAGVADTSQETLEFDFGQADLASATRFEVRLRETVDDSEERVGQSPTLPEPHGPQAHPTVPVLADLVGTWQSSFMWSEMQMSIYPDGRVVLLDSGRKDDPEEGIYQDGIISNPDEDESITVVLVDEDTLLGYVAEDEEGGAALEYRRLERVPRDKWVEEGDVVEVSEIEDSAGVGEIVDPVAELKRINVMWWGDERLDVTYTGRREVNVRTLWPTNIYPDGLAFHPDERLAVSKGSGTHADMFLAFLLEGVVDEYIVPLQFAPKGRAKKKSLEREGYFWFFNGALAFDAHGTCYFNLGNCSDNGIYKVTSREPVAIEKICDTGPSSSLQIPYFDQEHVYWTWHDKLYRYPVKESEDTLPKREMPWFRILHPKIAFYNMLLISPNELLLNVGFGANSWEDTRTLYINRTARTFSLIDAGEFGAMAISTDGGQLVAYDQSKKAFVQIELP